MLTTNLFFLLTPPYGIPLYVLNLSGIFPHRKLGEISSNASFLPLEGCLTSIICSVSELHFCAWLIGWKNGERKYIQSYPLWQSCAQSHSFSFVLLFSVLFVSWFSSLCPYKHSSPCLSGFLVYTQIPVCVLVTNLIHNQEIIISSQLWLRRHLCIKELSSEQMVWLDWESVGLSERWEGSKATVSVVDPTMWRSWAFEPSQGVFCQMLHNDSKLGQCSLHPHAESVNYSFQCQTCCKWCFVRYRKIIF